MYVFINLSLHYYPSFSFKTTLFNLLTLLLKSISTHFSNKPSLLSVDEDKIRPSMILKIDEFRRKKLTALGTCVNNTNDKIFNE